MEAQNIPFCLQEACIRAIDCLVRLLGKPLYKGRVSMMFRYSSWASGNARDLARRGLTDGGL
jgi:hypothetical protein